MRGIIPACVLEEVEDAIKETLWECHTGKHSEFKQHFDFCYEDGGGLAHITNKDDIHIHLADYFDVISGTSTGAIVATYLATKGGSTDTHILQSPAYSKGVARFKQVHPKLSESSALTKGSATAAEALFVATGKQIFTRGNFVMHHLMSLAFALPVVGRGLSTAYTALRRQYWEKGIDEVLQRSFGGGQFGPGVVGEETVAHAQEADRRGFRELAQDLRGIKLSDCGHDMPGGLHTSLLIPTFHIQLNRAVMFWHRHAPSALGHVWGYSTINRLRPRTALPDQQQAAITTAPVVVAAYDNHSDDDSTSASSTSSGHAGAGHLHDSGLQGASVSGGLAPQLSSTGLVTGYGVQDGKLQDSQAALSGGDMAFQLEQDGNVLHVYNVDFPLWCIVRASTAAPTFFPAGKIAGLGAGSPTKPVYLGSRSSPFPILSGDFADGGVVANNPTLAAIAFLEQSEGCHPRDIAVLSLGCGALVKELSVGHGGGAIAWAGGLVDVAMGAAVDAVTAVGEQMFKGAVEADNAAGSSSSFLRVQAVAFTPNATVTRNSLHVPEPLQSDSSNPTAAAANYDAIDTSNGDSKAKLWADCLGRMDRPDDWPILLEVGDKLGQHFREDIKRWVRVNIFNLHATH